MKLNELFEADDRSKYANKPIDKEKDARIWKDAMRKNWEALQQRARMRQTQEPGQKPGQVAKAASDPGKSVKVHNIAFEMGSKKFFVFYSAQRIDSEDSLRISFGEQNIKLTKERRKKLAAKKKAWDHSPIEYFFNNVGVRGFDYKKTDTSVDEIQQMIDAVQSGKETIENPTQAFLRITYALIKLLKPTIIDIYDGGTVDTKVSKHINLPGFEVTKEKRIDHVDFYGQELSKDYTRFKA